jgi:hypothetical protein
MWIASYYLGKIAKLKEELKRQKVYVSVMERGEGIGG